MYTRKNPYTLLSVNAPNVTTKRKSWIEHLSEYDKNKLIFIDESDVNTNLTRLYGRVFGRNRCVDSAPINTPQNTTILSSIRLNGETGYTTYQGGITKDIFIDYLKYIFVPILHDGDIVVMDNMRTHHSKAVKKVIEEYKINVLFLPPYSSDFNSIEKMWSKVKSVLRKLKIRELNNLSDAIKFAFSCVVPSDCVGWFYSAFVV